MFVVDGLAQTDTAATHTPQSSMYSDTLRSPLVGRSPVAALGACDVSRISADAGAATATAAVDASAASVNSVSGGGVASIASVASPAQDRSVRFADAAATETAIPTATT